MRKYTFVFKKKVVSDYLNNEGGYKYLAHKYQINRTLVRHWVRIYNYHGWEGLVGGGKSYTTKFKLDVIEYMETNGLSIQETAKKFNIGSNRLLLLNIWFFDKSRNAGIGFRTKRSTSSEKKWVFSQTIFYGGIISISLLSSTL
ncbi:hypothetical protein EfmGK941_10580 [Enterococcus faecium]|nr:hypothetical protein EfmGK941_10580 [Enterococcus faecium]